MKKKTEMSYPVVFADDVFGEDNAALADVLRTVTGSDSPRVMLVADLNVVQHTSGLGTRIGKYVQTHGIELAGAPVVLGGGEKIKSDSLHSVMRIANAAIEAKIGVSDCIVTLGGGTVLDVAGFAASQVRGGVKIVRMPTTAAAMIDAAFAETAAVNSTNVKDAFRIPCRPAAVVIDTAFAATVLDGVWRAGFSEAVRLAAFSDAPLLKKLAADAEAYRNRDMAVMADIVRAAVAVRQKKGSGNFGLWSALRLEALSGYKLPHGYSVALGIAVDTAYALGKGLLDSDVRDQIVGMLSACGAMDGAVHSRHLLSQTENVLRGLDAWRLSTGSEAIDICVGAGKGAVEKSPDRDIMRQALSVF